MYPINSAAYDGNTQWAGLLSNVCYILGQVREIRLNRRPLYLVAKGFDGSFDF